LSDYVETPARQAATLDVREHRPWPLPDPPWVQAQTWERLCFLHWPVPADELRALVADELTVDTHDDSAWLGITPFRVTGLRVRGLMPVPYVSTSLELNVRTYVTYGGKPGIWFFTLDAENRFFVEAAKRFYRLPDHHADRSWVVVGDHVEYSSARHRARFEGGYEPTSDVSPPELGTLEYFLTERYCLYTEHEGELYRAEIHHPPWLLQEAEAEVAENTMSPVEVEGEPLAHYSARQDVVIWALEAVGAE
jgi:uncharacterized protein